MDVDTSELWMEVLDCLHDDVVLVGDPGLHYPHHLYCRYYQHHHY